MHVAQDDPWALTSRTGRLFLPALFSACMHPAGKRRALTGQTDRAAGQQAGAINLFAPAAGCPRIPPAPSHEQRTEGPVPIVEPAPWRHQFFEHVVCPPDLSIPTDDPEA